MPVMLCCVSRFVSRYFSSVYRIDSPRPSPLLNKGSDPLLLGGDVAQLAEHRIGTLPTQVRLPGAARDFSPRVNFQCRLSYGVRKPPCTIACIYICAYVKDPVVHVRVQWIMETLKHPACTVSRVARLCRSWLSPGEGNPNFPWQKSHRDNTVVKSEIKVTFLLWN